MSGCSTQMNRCWASVIVGPPVAHLVPDRVAGEAVRRAGRPRRRASPRTASSAGRDGASRGSAARRAGTPCRACGRPRRARRCAPGRAGAACARRGRAAGPASRSTMSAWRARFACGPMPTPPYTAATCRCATSAIARNSSVTWLASSRVGARINAEGLRPLGVQPLDERHGERERLARAGARACEHVATGERVGDHQRSGSRTDRRSRACAELVRSGRTRRARRMSWGERAARDRPGMGADASLPLLPVWSFPRREEAGGAAQERKQRTCGDQRDAVARCLDGRGSRGGTPSLYAMERSRARNPVIS